MTEVATTDSSNTAVVKEYAPDSNGVSSVSEAVSAAATTSSTESSGSTSNEAEAKVKQETNEADNSNSSSIPDTAAAPSSTPPAAPTSTSTIPSAEPAAQPTSKKSSADPAEEEEEASEEEEEDEEEADEADATTDTPAATGISAPSPAAVASPAPILATTELNEDGQTMEDVKPALSSSSSSSDQLPTDSTSTIVKTEESPSPAISSAQPRTVDGFAVPLPPATASSANAANNARTNKASRISRAMRESQPAKNSTGDVTHCPCGDNLDQEGFMIQCETCEIWQHGACVGLTEKTTPEQYYCENCNPDDPIHIAFRKQHGDHIPVKGKGKRNKTKGAVPPVTPVVATSKDGKPLKEGAKKPGRVPKDKTEGGVGAVDATSTPATAGNKRKREDGSTPKPPRGAIRKGDDGNSVGVASPDLSKRPRLEDSNSVSNSGSHPPSTPVPSVRLPPSYNSIDFPDLPASLSSSSASELAALAADLDAQGDLTPQGSREARKIQRYIQMIQKMEDQSKGTKLSTTNEEGEDVDMEDEENGNGVIVQNLNDDSAAPQGLNSSFASARAAREARAKLRAEKLEKSEKDAEKRDANGNVIEDDKENGTGKKKKKGSARKEDEVPQLSAAEIRRLRTTAASQLRPLGPMYFGKKQLLLQGYRDEALRCDIGWSAPIHQQVPMAKRVVRNYLNDKTSNAQLDQVHQHVYHHTHERPPVAFPVHLPWVVRKDAKKSAGGDKDASKEEGDKSAGDTNMDVDSTAVPGNNRRAGSPAVKRESSDLPGDEPLPAPEAFFKSIDTSALPTKIQELITSFSNGSRSASPLAAVVTTKPVVEEPSTDVAMEDVSDPAAPSTTTTEAAVTISAIVDEKSGEASVAVKIEETVAAVESKENDAEAEIENAEDAQKIEEVASEDAPVSTDVPEPKIETSSEASGKADETEVGAASTEPAAGASAEPESVDASAVAGEESAAPASSEENTTMETLD